MNILLCNYLKKGVFVMAVSNGGLELYRARTDITFSHYKLKVPSADGTSHQTFDLETHNTPDLYFSLNNPNDYIYRSIIKSVKIADGIYAYGIDVSNIQTDTGKRKAANFINKVFRDRNTSCIVYNNHLIFNKIPTLSFITTMPSSIRGISNSIFSQDLYMLLPYTKNIIDSEVLYKVRVPFFSEIPMLTRLIQSDYVAMQHAKAGFGTDPVRINSSTSLLQFNNIPLHDLENLYVERLLDDVGYCGLLTLFAHRDSKCASELLKNATPTTEAFDAFYRKYNIEKRTTAYSGLENATGTTDSDTRMDIVTACVSTLAELVKSRYLSINLPESIPSESIVELANPRFEISTMESNQTKTLVDENKPITIILQKNQSIFNSIHDAIDLDSQNVTRIRGNVNYVFTAMRRLPEQLRLKKQGSVGVIYTLQYYTNTNDLLGLQYTKVDKIVGKFDIDHPISRREVIDLYNTNESVFIVIQDGSYDDAQTDSPEENILLKFKDDIISGKLTDDKIRNLTAVVEIQDMRYLGELSAVAFGINLDPRFNPLHEQVKSIPAMYYVNSRYIHRGSANELMPFPRNSDPIVGVFGRYEAGTFKTITERFAGPGDTNTFRVKLEPILQFVKETSRDELAKYTLDVAVALDTNSNGFYNKVSTFIYDKVKEFTLNDSVMDTKKDICGDALILRNFNVLKKRLVVTEFKPDIRKPDKGVYDTREITHYNDAKLGKRISKYWGETGDNNINPGKIYYSGLTGMGFNYSVAYNLRGFYPLFSIRDALTLDEPYYDPKLAPFKRLTPSIRTEIRAAGSETFLSDTKRFSKVDGKAILSSIYLPNSGYKRRSYGNQYYDDKLESTVNRNLISSSDGVIHEAYATTSSEPGKLSPVFGTFDVLLSKALPTDKWLPDGMMFDFDGIPFNKEWFVVNLWNNKEKDELIETKRFPTRITRENIEDYTGALFRPILEGNYIEFDDGKTDNALKGNPLVRMKLDVESGALDVNNIEHTTLKVKVHKSLRISQPWSVSAIALGVDLVGDKRSYDYIDSIVTRYLTRTNTTQLPITGLFSRASANSRYEPFLTPLSHLESEDYKVYTIDLKPIINYVKKTPIDTLIKQKLDLAVLSGLESKYAFNYISVSSLKGNRTVDKGVVNSGINLMHHYDYRDTLVITKAPDTLIGTIPAKSAYNMNLDISYSGESTVTWATRSNLDHGNLTSGGGDRYKFGVYYGTSGGYVFSECNPEVRSNILTYNTFYNPLGDSGELVKMQNILGESSTIGDIRTVKISGTTTRDSHIYLAIEPLFRAYRVGLGFSEIEELDRNPNVNKYGFTIRVWKDKTKAELISTTVVPGVIGGTIKIGPLANNNYIEFLNENGIASANRELESRNVNTESIQPDPPRTPFTYYLRYTESYMKHDSAEDKNASRDIGSYDIDLYEYNPVTRTYGNKINNPKEIREKIDDLTTKVTITDLVGPSSNFALKLTLLGYTFEPNPDEDTLETATNIGATIYSNLTSETKLLTKYTHGNVHNRNATVRDVLDIPILDGYCITIDD